MYQKCPICEGTGKGINNSSSKYSTCHVCNGRGIINSFNGLPPQNDNSDNGIVQDRNISRVTLEMLSKEELEDQNTIKTNDSKEHEFVECDLEICNEDICSLYKYNIDCPCLCCACLRKDGKEGCFKLK